MFAIILTFIATLCIQLGYLLWKKAGDTLPKIGKEPVFIVVKKFFTNKTWLLGFLLLDFGWILSVKAVEIGALSIVQPLLSAGSFFAVLLAVIFLRERLTSLEWFGMGVTVLGVVLISSQIVEVVSIAIVWSQVYLWLLVLGGLTIGGLLIGMRKQNGEVFLACAAGMSFALAGILTNAMTTSSVGEGNAVTFQTAFMSPLLYAVIITNVLGLFLIQVAFQKGRASIVVPLNAAMISGISVLAGVYLFGEKIQLIHVVGVGCIGFGSVLLEQISQKKAKEKTDN